MPAPENPSRTRRRLAPNVPVVARAPDAVQLGSSPSHSLVLTGMQAGDHRVLDLLARGTNLSALDGDARRLGADPGRGRALVATLDERRLLVDADTPATTEALRLRAERWCWQVGVSPARALAAAARSTRSVSITGPAVLAVPLATGFAAAGVGGVAVTDRDAVAPTDVVPGGAGTGDVGRPAGSAAAAAVRRVSSVTRAAARARPDLGVVVAHDAHDPAAAAAWLAADVAHLGVLVRDRDIVVGPLVVPGLSPCLRCLDLARRDRDPAWPAVRDQLLRRSASAPPSVVPALGQVAAGLGVLVGLAALDGEASSVTGLAASVSLPLAAPTWRRWHQHPDCGCSDPSGPVAPSGEAGDTIVG